MALLYVKTDGDILDWQTEGILVGVFANQLPLNTTPLFRQNISSDLPLKLRELYRPVPFYFRPSERAHQMHELTLMRQIMNHFLDEPYFNEDKITQAIMDFGNHYSMRTRTVELGLATMLLEHWMETGLLCREDDGIVKVMKKS
jgi:hypothetical protein